MERTRLLTKNEKGFTLIELIVVIIVIAILAGIVIVSYGAWRTSVAESNVKSDLNQLTTAMDSARTWSNGFPVLSGGADFSSDTTAKKVFTPSSDIVMTYVRGSDGDYCVNASSKKVPDVRYHVLVMTYGTTAQPEPGDCGSSAAI